MISFEAITTDFRSIVERRRRQLAFLFSTGAAFAILADGVFQGRTPKSLDVAPSSLIVAGAIAMMLIAFVTALREARLHRGLTYNGEMYHAYKTDGTILREAHSRRLKLLGVSSALFTIAVMTGVALETFLAFVFGAGTVLAVAIAAISAALMVVVFRFQHRKGIELADAHRAAVRDTYISADQMRRHTALSIDDAHRDMLELLSLVGLAVFSVFQLLSGIDESPFDAIGAIPMSAIRNRALGTLSTVLLAITGIALFAYSRLRYRVGVLSTIQNPTENAFRLLSIDDSFYGLLVLVALLWFEFTLLFSSAGVAFVRTHRGAIALTCAALCIFMERFYLWQKARKQK